jgi:hypothetical protein
MTKIPKTPRQPLFERDTIVLSFLCLLSVLTGCKDAVWEKVKKVPVSYVYTRGSDVRIEFHDGYSNPAYRFTDAEKQTLIGVLNALPQDHLIGIHWIAMIPMTDKSLCKSELQPTSSYTDGGIVFCFDPTTATAASANTPANHQILLHGQTMDVLTGPQSSGKSRPQISLTTQQGGLSWFLAVAVHEIGHQVEYHRLKGSEGQEWVSLHNQSTQSGDFAPPDYGGPPNGTGPYGATDEQEDFATTYAEYVTNPTYAFQDAIAQAQLGQPILLEKYLFMTALFTDANSHTINFYVQNYTTNTLDPHPSTYQRTANQMSFIVADDVEQLRVVFNLSGNSITGIQYQYYLNNWLPPITFDLAKPIPLPTAVLNRMPTTDAPSTSTNKTPSSRGIRLTPMSGRPPFPARPIETPLGERPIKVISTDPPTQYVPVMSPSGIGVMKKEWSMVQHPELMPSVQDLVGPHLGEVTVQPQSR